jgi:hypothetical protein
VKALLRFVSRVAAEAGGEVHQRGSSVDLLLPGRDPISVEAETDDRRVPHERLRFVEKQAAIALLAEPSLFALLVLDNGKKVGRRVEIIRVAFGYYIVNGRRCFERYTAYVEPRSGTTATLRGDDRLFSEATSRQEGTFDREVIERLTPTILSLVRGAHEHFVTGARQVAEFQAMADRRRNRLFELELLYARKSRHHIRTYGVDPRDSASRPPSATEEFRRRKMGVLRKYLPRVSVNILSVGVVRTPARRKGGQLLAPFLPEPADDRWLAAWQEPAV